MALRWYTPHAFLSTSDPVPRATTKSTAWTSSCTVYLISLILYVILALFSIYIWRKHGRRNAMGSLYLTLFCTVQIIAGIEQLLPSNRDVTVPSTTAVIFSSIGLSPLLLMLAGYAHYIHELNLDCLQGNGKSASSVKRTKILLWILQIQIHLISSVGITLLISAGIKLASDADNLTPSKISHEDKLRNIGSVILTLLWVGLAQYLLWLYIQTRRSGGPSSAQRTLAFWTLWASPFVGAKAIFGNVSSFDHSDRWLSPIYGALWVKIASVLCVPLAAVLCVCIGAFRTRNAKAKGLYRGDYVEMTGKRYGDSSYEHGYQQVNNTTY